jgi:alkaline phosphatase D
MNLSRRDFVLAALGAAALEACGSSSKKNPVDPGDAGPLGDGGLMPDVTALPVDKTAFAHGVASGDPARDSVLLWTRFTGTTPEPQSVLWAVATDPELQDVVSAGTAEAHADRDFTVKVVAGGLEPGTTYYYAFFLAEKSRTVIGRTRTLPQDTSHVRLAFTSCSNFGNGYFHAYRNIAKREDLDVWVHLGDYIYEYSELDYSDPTIDRPLDPATETLTLSDYRRRHALYKTDPDLQEIHRQHPMIVVWDDHEVANNAWKNGAENHQDGEGDFATRKAAGIKAFLEWLPIRVEESTGTPNIYRQFAFGELFDLMMLDTRHLARSEQPGTDAFLPDQTIDNGTPDVWNNDSRELIGKAQETWFLKALSDSQKRGARWRVIGNQIIFSRLGDLRDDTHTEILFCDFWDGYKPAHKRVFDHLINEKIDNLVFLTGDIHTSWALELPPEPFPHQGMYDPETGAGSIGIEIVGPSVTSQALEVLTQSQQQSAYFLLTASNPHLKFHDNTHKGYVLVDINEERVQAEWYFVSDIKKREGAAEELAKSYTCASGTAHLVEASEPSTPKAGDGLAPEE